MCYWTVCLSDRLLYLSAVRQLVPTQTHTHTDTRARTRSNTYLTAVRVSARFKENRTRTTRPCTRRDNRWLAGFACVRTFPFAGCFAEYQQISHTHMYIFAMMMCSFVWVHRKVLRCKRPRSICVCHHGATISITTNHRYTRISAASTYGSMHILFTNRVNGMSKYRSPPCVDLSPRLTQRRLHADCACVLRFVITLFRCASWGVRWFVMCVL